MTTYPDSAYTPVMDFYNTLPAELKPQAQKVLGDFAKRYKQGEAPPDEMLHNLKVFAHSSINDLEAKTSAAPNESVNFSAVGNVVGLAGIIGSVTAFAAGAYSLGIATMALAGTYLFMDKYKPKLEHSNR